MTTSIFKILFAATLSCALTCAKADDKNILKVGFEPAYAPFEFMDENTKELTGFDVDLITAIAKTQGYEIEVSTMPFDSLIPALMTENIDVALSAISITPAREKRVEFSKPYYTSGLSILIDKKNKDTYKEPSDLKDKTVCVQIGTTGASYTKDVLKASEVIQFNTAAESYLELQSGRCVAAVNDKPVNDYYLSTSKAAENIVSLEHTLSAEDYGIAIKKGRKDLKKMIDSGFETIKQNGEFDSIYNKWFGKNK